MRDALRTLALATVLFIGAPMLHAEDLPVELGAP